MIHTRGIGGRYGQEAGSGSGSAEKGRDESNCLIRHRVLHGLVV